MSPAMPPDTPRSDEARPVGEEARKSHGRRLSTGFIDTYLSGAAVLDIGYKGYRDDVVPIVPSATGVELDYPGYDGVTLPFDDCSQDAVFASHCLEHIADFRNALQDWFRVLKVGGHLLVMVPHKFLYEKKSALPSNYNADHKRFYTPASLMAEVEASLQPNMYRLRHLVDNDVGYDYSIGPERHAGGCYEIELVIEKIAQPNWSLALPPGPIVARAVVSQAADAGTVLPRSDRTQLVPVPGRHGVAAYAFGSTLPAQPRILALKLDHLGDFIIGLPSLRRLRSAFPTAHIHLVVGSWNRATAEASGVADEVGVYDFFPQNGANWDGTPVQPVEWFRAVIAGHYDIAIDLRVDDDTRFLLEHADAAIRCGIQSHAWFKFLDVALPAEHEHRANPFTLSPGLTTLGVERFVSRMPVKHLFAHETDFRPCSGHVIFGPHMLLPPGSFRARFALQLTGWRFGLGKSRVILDIARGDEIVALKRLKPQDLRALPDAGVELEFENHDTTTPHEFRVFIKNRPLRSGLRFAGVQLEHVSAPVTARFRRSELHIGEQLSLLVQLLVERTTPLYEPGPPDAKAGGNLRVVVAPVSNSDLRDWPAPFYAELVRLLVDRLGCTVTLIGSPQQHATLEWIRGKADRGTKVELGAQIPWPEVPGILRQADLVICNNSGIAHLAASVGALTLAIYSGSHQPQEWGPRGARSHAVMAVVPCSPCGYDRLVECPHDHTCMKGLSPQTVFGRAAALLGMEAGEQPGQARLLDQVTAQTGS